MFGSIVVFCIPGVVFGAAFQTVGQKCIVGGIIGYSDSVYTCVLPLVWRLHYLYPGDYVFVVAADHGH